MSTIQKIPLIHSTDEIDVAKGADTIVIVDAAIRNYKYLLASPLLGMEVHILKGQTDGIAQIEALLSQSQQLSSIHLMCKGGPGQLNIGTTRLSGEHLWAYADELRQWRCYLAEDAEIVIYGCELTTNRAGQALLSWLQLLIGANVRWSAITPERSLI